MFTLLPSWITALQPKLPSSYMKSQHIIRRGFLSVRLKRRCIRAILGPSNKGDPKHDPSGA